MILLRSVSRAPARRLGALLAGPVIVVAAERIPGAPARGKAARPPEPRAAVAPALAARAQAESTQPVRPGQPGEQPFWNGEAVQFLYAPAFDLAPAAGVARKRSHRPRRAGAFTGLALLVHHRRAGRAVSPLPLSLQDCRGGPPAGPPTISSISDCRPMPRGPFIPPPATRPCLATASAGTWCRRTT